MVDSCPDLSSKMTDPTCPVCDPFLDICQISTAIQIAELSAHLMAPIEKWEISGNGVILQVRLHLYQVIKAVTIAPTICEESVNGVGNGTKSEPTKLNWPKLSLEEIFEIAAR